jgi:hypothetical protein
LGLPCGQRYWRSRQSEHNDCRKHNAQMLGSDYWFFHYSSPRFDDRDQTRSIGQLSASVLIH